MKRAYVSGLICGVFGTAFAQSPAFNSPTGLSINWPLLCAGLGVTALIGWVYWHYFRGKSSATVTASAAGNEAIKLASDMGHRAHDLAAAAIAAVSKHADANQALSAKLPDPTPVKISGMVITPSFNVPAGATSIAAAGTDVAPAPTTGAAPMPNVFMEFPPNPNHDPMIEGQYFIRWLSGAQETPSGTPIVPPTEPAHTDGNWTVMLDQWTKNPEWGNGPPSWEKAYQAAKALSTGAPPPAAGALPQPGQPGYDTVLKYITQATPQEKAKFFNDNSATLNPFRANLPDIATVNVLLSRNLGYLLMARYDAGSNTYLMPDGRTLGQWSLAELGLDK